MSREVELVAHDELEAGWRDLTGEKPRGDECDPEGIAGNGAKVGEVRSELRGHAGDREVVEVFGQIRKGEVAIKVKKIKR